MSRRSSSSVITCHASLTLLRRASAPSASANSNATVRSPTTPSAASSCELCAIKSRSARTDVAW